MTDNEKNLKIAEWLDYRWTPPQGLHDGYWTRPSGLFVDSIKFNERITLWHGEDGILAEIERNGFVPKFIMALDSIVGMAKCGLTWDVLRATPAQLTAALIKVIEEESCTPAE